MEALNVTMRAKLLDKGYIELVDWMGDDLTPVRSARTSYDKADKTGEDLVKDHALIKSLMERGHTSPFEAVTVTFEVKAPIFVFRQWQRHRTQSYNEMSARYTEMPDEWWVPSIEDLREQDKFEKQATHEREISSQQLMISLNGYEQHQHNTYALYKALLKLGWPREQARAVLPFAMYSKMVTTMNLLNAFRFMSLRLDKHAQKEIRVYAEAMREQLGYIFPEIMKHYNPEAWLPIQKTYEIDTIVNALAEDVCKLVYATPATDDAVKRLKNSLRLRLERELA